MYVLSGLPETIDNIVGQLGLKIWANAKEGSRQVEDIFCETDIKADTADIHTYQRVLQGCQIFLDTIYQNEGKYTKLPQNYQLTKCQ
jgi:hypothetical protein